MGKTEKFAAIYYASTLNPWSTNSDPHCCFSSYDLSVLGWIQILEVGYSESHCFRVPTIWMVDLFRCCRLSRSLCLNLQDYGYKKVVFWGGVYFYQLSGAHSTPKLVKIPFFDCFQPSLIIFTAFQWFFVWNKKVWKTVV